MIVVPVLITSCQVSENLNMGPDTIQIMMIKKAMINAVVLPVALVTKDEIFSKPDGFFDDFFFIIK